MFENAAGWVARGFESDKNETKIYLPRSCRGTTQVRSSHYIYLFYILFPYQTSIISPIGKAELAWNRYYSICNSQIFDVFGGQFESVIRCDTCSFESPTYEPFWDLSLPIPAPDANGNVTLASCLKEFGKRESLEAEWNCSRCKTRRSATKSISIFRCPEILVIRK